MSGWKSIGWKRRSGCRYWRGGSSLPRCTLGTYRKWRGGGEEEEGDAHLFLLPRVTSRLISFHFLSLHPRCVYSLRGWDTFSLSFSLSFVRHGLCTTLHPPGEYSRDDRRHVEKGCRRFCEPNENSSWRFSPTPRWTTMEIPRLNTGEYILYRGGEISLFIRSSRFFFFFQSKIWEDFESIDEVIIFYPWFSAWKFDSLPWITLDEKARGNLKCELEGN